MKRFYCRPETAHNLTKMRKKANLRFYFRTLTATGANWLNGYGKVDRVLCESNASDDIIEKAGGVL